MAAVELNRGGASELSATNKLIPRNAGLGSAKPHPHHLMQTTSTAVNRMTADHYQSHRELGRDLSNNTASGVGQSHQGSSGLGSTLVQPILSTKAAGVNHPMGGGVGSGTANMNIFKNFISQYQSHAATNASGSNPSSSHGPKGGASMVSQSASLANASAPSHSTAAQTPGTSKHHSL